MCFIKSFELLAIAHSNALIVTEKHLSFVICRHIRLETALKCLENVYRISCTYLGARNYWFVSFRADHNVTSWNGFPTCCVPRYNRNPVPTSAFGFYATSRFRFRHLTDHTCGSWSS